MTRIILILTLLLASVDAGAQFRPIVRTDHLIGYWRAHLKWQEQGAEVTSRDDLVAATMFPTYIVGIAEGHLWGEMAEEPDFCIPADTSVAQMVQVVNNYLENNFVNANRFVYAVTVVWTAFEETWPCNN